jgi:predicted transcriptional regulator of viral defense system
MKHLTDYLRYLQAHGEVCFTSEQAKKILGISRQALNISLYRARYKKIIATIAKNFHVIVSPEYQILGCLPPNYFIDSLMQYGQTNYYVCLLSAAECYGAAHQKPQIYQVMVAKRIRPIRCGKIGIDFVYKKKLTGLPINNFEGPAGYFKISSPELTAMDLLSYPSRVGGLNRIVTILTELVDSFDVERLLALVKFTKQQAWAQKLGFILEQTTEIIDEEKRDKCVIALKQYFQQQSPRFVPLISGEIKNNSKNRDWHIIINTDIEGDL